MAIDPHPGGFQVVLSQPGLPDQRYVWSVETLIRFANDLGRDWLGPSVRVVDVEVDGYAFRVFRDTDLGEFELEFGGERWAAKTHEEVLQRMRELATLVSPEMDVPHTVELRAHDDIPQSPMR